MQPKDPPPGIGSAALDLRCEELCGKFEASWRRGGRPRIEDFLTLVSESQRGALLSRLLAAEIRLHDERGTALEPDQYRQRFAEHSAVVQSILAAHSSSRNVGERLSDPNLLETILPESDAARSGTQRVIAGGSTNQPVNDEHQATEERPSSHNEARQRNADNVALGRFKDYELLSEIARGGMGVVYKARQIKLNRIVAVKMILAGQLASEGEIRRFYSEAEAVARLDHPGIVPIYEVDAHDDRHFFSMAFIDGSNLQDRVLKGPLPQRNAAELMRKVALAVQYAHAHGVVHRDLKPRNILVTSDGEPKITDFGLAKSLDSGQELTVSGQIIGTPGYMPPEQALGEISQIGPLSDVYSLGAVLYYLLSGRPPFQSASLIDTLKQVIESPPVSPRLLNPAVDRDIETICLKCLEKSPQDRYQSAEELADELQRFLNGEPIRARRQGALARSWRWSRQHPTLVALAASVVVLLFAVGFAVSAGQRARETRQMAALQREIETGLDHVELDEPYVTRMNGFIADLQAKEPTAAAVADRRLTEALAGEIQQELRAPKLTPQLVERMTAAIALVEPRDAGEAAKLTEYLTRRRRDWQTIFTLQAPFESAAEVFPARIVQRNDLGLTPAQVVPLQPTLTQVPCEGIVQLQASFAPDWEKSARLGLALNADRQNRPGYEFVLSLKSPQQLGDEDSVPVDAVDDRSFARWRELGLPFVATIQRCGRVLWQQEISSSELPADSLTLRATRDRSELTFQVGPTQPLRFIDSFPLSARQSGVFGIAWPAGVTLHELNASRKERPTAASPLELGDELFEQERFAEAIELYQTQSRDTDQRQIELEAIFKRGLCRAQLGQLDEAANDFEVVMSDGSERWPPLAGCWLWVTRLRQKRNGEANSLFDTLTAKYEFGQLTGLVPQELCEEILSHYRSNLTTFAGVLRYNPEIIPTTDRLAAVDRLLSADGKGNFYTQIDVARAYHLQGDVAMALQMAEPICRDSREPGALRQYCRLLRLNQQPRISLEAIERFYNRRPDLVRGSVIEAEVERARAFAALGDWDRCEQAVEALDRYWREQPRRSPTAENFICIMRGMLLERKGSRAAAEKIWSEGYRRLRNDLSPDSHLKSETLVTMILGSLSGEMSEEDAGRYWSLVVQRGGGNAYFRQLQSLTNPQTTNAAVRNMWRSEVGRQWAEAFAFESLTLRDRVKLPVVLIGVEYFNLILFGGNASHPQQLAMFEVMSRAYEQLLIEGKLTLSHVAQLVFTWKGTTNFLGWGGVGPTLTPEMRSGFAYLFGLRFWRHGDRAQALKFLEQAVAESAADQPLGKAARQSHALALAGQGQLTIVSDWTQPVLLEITAGDNSVQQVTVVGETAVSLAPGKVHAKLLDTNSPLKLSWDSLEMVPLTDRLLQITWPWLPTSNDNVLPGFVSRPSARAAPNRWQVVPRYAWPLGKGLAFSGDGALLAIAGGDQLLRILDARERRLQWLLADAPRDMRVLAWSPHEDKLLAAGNDRWVRGWKFPAGDVFFERQQAAGVAALAWSADGNRFAIASFNQPVCVFNSDGNCVAEFTDRDEGMEGLALDKHGKRLVTRSYLPAEQRSQLKIYDVATRRLEDVLPQTDIPYFHVSISPDDRWLFSGEHLGGVRFWDLATREERFTYRGSNHRLTAWHWSRDGKQLSLLGEGNGVTSLDTSGEVPKMSNFQEDAKLQYAAWSPDGTQFAAIKSGGRLEVTSQVDGQADSLFRPAAHWETMAYCRANQRFVAGGTQGQLAILDSSARPIDWRDAPDSSAWNTLVWNPQGTLFAAARKNGTLAVWRSDGTLLKLPRTMARDRWQAIAWHPAGKLLSIATPNRTVRIVEAETGDEVLVLPEFEFDIGVVAWSPTGQLAAIDDRGMVQLFDEQGSPLHRFQFRESGRWVRRAQFSPDGNRLALLEHDHTVSLWSTQGKMLRELADGRFHEYHFAWSPDGSQLATADRFGALRLWSADGELLTKISGPSSIEAVGLEWLDSDRLATACSMGSVQFWSRPRQRPEDTTWLAGSDEWIRWSTGGEILESRGAIQEQVVVALETEAHPLQASEIGAFFAQLAAAGSQPGEIVPTPRATAENTSDIPGVRPAKDEPILKPVAVQTGTIRDKRLAECSGLARCGLGDGLLWTISDSEKLLFLVKSSGDTTQAIAVDVPEDHDTIDWEDLAAFRLNDKDYLLVGDVGDNAGKRKSVQLHLLSEPDAAQLDKMPAPIKPLSTFTVTYEDGPHDCEALAVDVAGSVILLATKQLAEESTLYEVPLDLDANEPLIARKVARLTAPVVTGMSLSPDGNRLVVLTGLHAVEFTRDENEAWSQAMSRQPRRMLLPPLPQGEAITYSRDGKSLFVTSEGEDQPLWQVKLSP